MKKAGVKGYVYVFSVDYDDIAIADILDIHKYLMKKNWNSIKMFRFVNQIFISTVMFFVCNVSGVNSSKCMSMNNEEYKIRPEIINIDSNESLFYPYNIKVNYCSGSCNNINNPYSKLCIPDVVKNMNVKVFNLMSRTNETRYIKWHETCKYKCRLDASVCNNEQRWNNDKCR